MNVIECKQGTPEWLAARAGKVTASRISAVMATVKSGEAATRRDYRAELVVERLTGLPTEDGYTNALMQWGTEQEPFARAAYEIRKDVMVSRVGFVIHPHIPLAGASPDGLVGTDGLVEIKCPKTATHLSYILDNSVPNTYYNQMQWQMACTEREWCDFVSYDPRMPEHLQLFVVRCNRDQTWITAMEVAVECFLTEVNAIVRTLERVEVPA